MCTMSVMSIDAVPVPAGGPRLSVLLFTDLVGSVQFKTDLGTELYAKLLARHNELFRRSIDPFPGAKILQNTGDGFLASFPTPSDAVRFALLFQSRMAREPWQPRPIE